jgi:hypothetical protein
MSNSSSKCTATMKSSDIESNLATTKWGVNLVGDAGDEAKNVVKTVREAA